MIQVYAWDQVYVWNGEVWVGNLGRPCPVGQDQMLAGQFLEQFFAQHGCDWQVLSSRWAAAGLNIYQYGNLQMLARAALARAQRHQDVHALALYCHCARVAGKPELALDLVERNAHLENGELLTCQAASLCDLGRWREAEVSIQRALAQGANHSAKQVRFRILAYRAAAGL